MQGQTTDEAPAKACAKRLTLMSGGRLWQILLPPATQYSIKPLQLRETFEVFLPHFAVP
jgi:hypothetical protein